MIFNKERAEQLEARILKLSILHKKIHSQQFPKDGTEGEYIVNQKLRTLFYDRKKEELGTDDIYTIFSLPDAPLDWNETPSVLRLKKVRRLSSKLRRELRIKNNT